MEGHTNELPKITTHVAIYLSIHTSAFIMWIIIIIEANIHTWAGFWFDRDFPMIQLTLAIDIDS